MSTITPIRFRVIGGASALAISAGLGSASVTFAMAPDPVAMVPTPAAPAAPGNAEECAVVNPVAPIAVVCAPGTDADGFADLNDDVTLTVEDGAQVQGEITLTDGASVTVDGDIVVTTFENALDLGQDATVVNNGFISANPFFDGIIAVDENSDVTNNGTIASTGQTGVIGIVVEADSTIVNNGDIILSGTNNAAIIGGLAFDATGVTVTNSSTGRIIVDTGAAGIGAGIALPGNATVVNDGLIQTFGDFTYPVLLGDDSTVINNGNIVSAGDSSNAVSVEDRSTVTNGVDGVIMTSGDLSFGILGLVDATIQNDGVIMTEGVGASGILVGNRATITNGATGEIITNADNAEGLFLGKDGTVNNAGLIETAGDDAYAVQADDRLTLVNSGSIIAVDRAVNAGDDVTITNEVGGLINTTGDADTIQTGDNTTIVNNGTISNEGFDTKIIDAGDNLTVTNNGTITSDWKGIEGEANFTLTNNEGALIFSAFDEAVEADGPGLTVVNHGEIIAPQDDAIDGGDNVTITNTGLIRGGQNDGLELNSGTITNSGTIESLSSDPDGDFILDGMGNPTADREIDAGIDFDGGTDGNEDGVVINLAGGVIIGDIGINTSSGATGSDANEGVQQIVNYGTITGRGTNPETGREDAVLLGEGDDEFQQWQTGVTNGTVDGQGGDDTLIFGNDSGASISRSLTDINDPLQYTGFESLNFLDVSGGIVLTGVGSTEFNILGGDITISGEQTAAVNVDGEGSLTVTATGSIETASGDALEVDVDGYEISNAGTISAADGRAIDARGVDGTTITNSGTIEAFDRAIDAGDDVTITNEVGGLINTTGDDDTIQTGDNLTIVNNGTISNEGFDTKIIDAGDNLTVTNNGTITSDWKGIEGEANFTLTNNEGALIFSALDEAVEADGDGLTVINHGEIIAPKDDAIDGGNQVTVINTGLIRGGENDGMELDSGTVTNSGIIESLSSDPNGDFSDAALTNRELDAGIDVDGGGDDGDTLITNLAGGIIRGDIGINASSGNFVDDGMGGSEQGSPANFGSQTVVNFGEITANAVNPVTGRMDAVLLSFGDDEFQQWSGAVVNGWVDLEDGNDTFILEGASSSVTGGVSGGAGTDIAILAGVLDSDNIFDFETIQLGSTLGGTLNDLDIEGARTIAGDIVVVGVVNVDLGVDSLTTTGSVTLEDTSVVNIATPLDEALVGQTVAVLDGNGTFTDNGATINILDDDLLLEYTPVGALSVEVTSFNPLENATDANIATMAGAVDTAINAGTLNGGTFDVFNALPDAAAYSDALVDAMPSLSDGVAREIFESGSLASQALDRHLQGEDGGIWGQIAVRGAEQEARSESTDGYESDQYVFAIGADMALGTDLRVGLMASYTDIEVRDETSTGAGTGTSDVLSYKFGAYLASKLFGRGFLNAEGSFLTGEVTSERSGTLGSIRSDGDFSGFAARAVLGYDLLADENVSVTPTIGLNAARITFDDTTELGGFGFTIDRDDAEFAEVRAGLEFATLISEGVNGFVQGTIVHDLIDDAGDLTVSSAELPTFSLGLPARQQDRFELSAGASIDVTDGFAIDLGYLGDFANGYNAHSGRATLRIAF